MEEIKKNLLQIEEEHNLIKAEYIVLDNKVLELEQKRQPFSTGCIVMDGNNTLFAEIFGDDYREIYTEQAQDGLNSMGRSYISARQLLKKQVRARTEYVNRVLTKIKKFWIKDNCLVVRNLIFGISATYKQCFMQRFIDMFPNLQCKVTGMGTEIIYFDITFGGKYALKYIIEAYNHLISKYDNNDIPQIKLYYDASTVSQ